MTSGHERTAWLRRAEEQAAHPEVLGLRNIGLAPAPNSGVSVHSADIAAEPLLGAARISMEDLAVGAEGLPTQQVSTDSETTSPLPCWYRNGRAASGTLSACRRAEWG